MPNEGATNKKRVRQTNPRRSMFAVRKYNQSIAKDEDFATTMLVWTLTFVVFYAVTVLLTGAVLTRFHIAS